MDTGTASIVRNIVGVLKLDSSAYVRIAGDSSATAQAKTVVVAVAIIAGLTGYTVSLTDMALSILASLAIWLVLASLTHFICNAFATTTNVDRSFSRIMRLTGFAQAPGLFSIATLIPLVGGLFGLALAFWSLLTWFNAIKVAGPFTTQGACMVLVLQLMCLMLLMFLVLFLALILFGVTYVSFQIGGN